jgi:3,4-dihydroxy 2-butanone 4-phosphate synthase / GTP cyclohydrolase II
LVRVHVKNPLSDVLHWQRDDLSISAHQAMATIAKENVGVLVVLSEAISSEQLLAQITEQDGHAATKIKQWRQNGAGAQILADLGLSKLRVLGTPRRQVALAGYGLEVIEYVSPRG